MSTERLYYPDCHTLEFSARVVAVTTVGDRPGVILDRTAFYPTSGGQPFDTGRLGKAQVVDVVDEPEGIVHVLAGPIPDVGELVTGQIDRERRLDHTQQHTGQHVLSQAFERLGDLQTGSFHLGVDACTIDLNVPALDPATVRQAEELANQIVLENRPILIHFTPAENVERFGLRKPAQKAGVPRSGEIRIVEIEGFDFSACGGTHVERTGAIGPIKVRRWERRGSVNRVEFLCGWRALADYAGRFETTRSLAERLSVADSDLFATVSRSLDEVEQLRDDVSRLREMLLDAEAASLAESAQPLSNRPDVQIVCHGYVGRSPDELKRLALAVAKHTPCVVLLGSGGERCHVVFAQSSGLPFDLSRVLRQVAPLFGGRGGGSRDLAQGGAPNPGSVDAALATASQLLAAGP
ncbi:MAG TPA: DHHA1 domain-containing protein [Chloroflexota bacterium]|nr:DHHA1 domain-containing protein [Chloroflexota bacterium]